MTQKYFSERLKALRLAKNLKQSEIAALLGVSVAQVSDIERNRRSTSIDKLIALADYFDVSLDYLVGRSDNPDVSR